MKKVTFASFLNPFSALFCICLEERNFIRLLARNEGFFVSLYPENGIDIVVN